MIARAISSDPPMILSAGLPVVAVPVRLVSLCYNKQTNPRSNAKSSAMAARRSLTQDAFHFEEKVLLTDHADDFARRNNH